ncbi:hypothetical protein J2W21_000240 [Sinomonas atrocyanea]|jgi:hypothetical protein|uniref:hypothetical protein n=1 Tax=Sinomonas atrocyanea TaxID=37927 RepID=UPI002784266D|nr:hypothetical protein [Sinomonas atrocyanea]MDP9882761.1 hypothetical protein [Sinomonas atrocyanea]
MPSYRAVLQITGLRPGHPPERVMDAAREALGSLHHVEAHQIDVVRGVPQITLRFLVEAENDEAEVAAARRAALVLQDAVEDVATTGRLQVLRRRRGAWIPV